MSVVSNELIPSDQLGAIGGSQVATTAAANVIGGGVVIHRVDVPAAAGTTNVTIVDQIRVNDCWFVKTNGAGGAGDTLAVQNAAVPISDLMSTNVADQVLVRAATIDDAQATIAASGTLRIVTTGAGDVAATVYVRATRV